MLNAGKHLYRTVGRTRMVRQRCFPAFSMTDVFKTNPTQKANYRKSKA